MHGTISTTRKKANEHDDRTADKSADCGDKSVKNDSQWFKDACRQIYGCVKAGTSLHFVSGFDERSCQRYAAGCVRPPAYLLRRLLRSAHGWVWLQAAMDGADAEWWRDVRIAYQLEQQRKQLNR